MTLRDGTQLVTLICDFAPAAGMATSPAASVRANEVSKRFMKNIVRRLAFSRNSAESPVPKVLTGGVRFFRWFAAADFVDEAGPVLVRRQNVSAHFKAFVLQIQFVRDLLNAQQQRRIEFFVGD